MLRRVILTAFVVCMTTTAYAQQVGSPLVVPMGFDAPSISGSALLKQLQNPDSGFYAQQGTFTVSGAKSQVIQSAARGVGIRGGYYEEATRINDLLMTKHRRALDSFYNFGPLMLQNGVVVPPSITQMQKVVEQNGPNFIYLSTGSYEIVRDARLTTVQPSWLDYLMLPIREVRPPENLQMTSSQERSIWERSVQDGWVVGVQEARATFQTALATLHRDYNGMKLYHQLAGQGAVSVPQIDINKVRWRVTEDGKRAFEGEATVKLTVNSTFRRRR